MRLVLLTEDKSVIPNESDILSQYDNIYLLQFTSIQQTMNAYTYFKGLSLSVEPDMPVETAGNENSQKTNDYQKESDTDEIVVSKDESQVSEKENPIANLKDVMKETADNEITVSHDENVIALIDTGVGESANVIDRISVIDDVLTSTGHGNDMLQAIVSQNPDAKVLSIRAMNDNGLGTISSLVAAMEYAINENVDMMNLSLYARTTLSTSVLKSEIQKAVDAGIMVIGAAGNDGVDVADYVPGSVEEALIIGAANEKGARLETSNFGATVDYNVVAESTSEATALFTGYVSKNGLESVDDVVNQGMIYETGFGGSEEDIEDSLAVDDVQFYTKMPEKGGKIQVLMESDVVDTPVSGIMFPKKEGYASRIPIASGSPLKVGLIADEGYRIASGCVTTKEGEKLIALEDCAGQDSYAYDMTVPNEDFVIEVIFERTGEPLSKEAKEYQELMDVSYHEVLPDMDAYFKNAEVSPRKTVQLTNGRQIPYPSGAYYTNEFYVDGGVGLGYCSEPNKTSPPSGTYTSTKIDDLSYAKVWKYLMLTNIGMELEDSDGDNLWGKDSSKDKRTVYIHATIGNIKTGVWTGLTQDEINGIEAVKNQAQINVNSGNYDSVLSKYVLHNISLGGIYQDIVYITPPEKGGLSVQKGSADTTITNGNTNYSLKGAQYGIWNNASCSGNPLLTITTDDKGYAKTADDALDAGTYYVKETKASPGYDLDPTIHTKVVVAGDPGIGNSVQSKEPPKTGAIKIIKKSANPSVSEGNNCYSLKDAQFTICKNSSCTDVYKTISTDESGVATLTGIPLGTYYIYESKPPKGFEPKLDGEEWSKSKPVKVTLTNDNADASLKNPLTYECVNEPGNDPASVQVEKIWNGEETPTIPPLAGTQFTIWYYDGFFTKSNLPDYDSYNSTAKRKWVIELRWEEDVQLWMAILGEDYLVPELSDPLYKSPKGNTILPYGTYVFLETKSAPGYETEGVLKDQNGNVVGKTNEKYVTQVNKDSGAVELHGGHKYKGENEPKPNRIRIRKVDENGNPLAGAEFTLKNSKGEIVSTKTSGADGYVVWEDLYPDRYTVTEIKTKNGKNLLKDPIVIDLPKRISDADITKYGIDKNKLSEKDPTEGKYFLFDVEYEISNHANFEAPMTGGWTDFMTFVPLIAGMTGLTGVGAVAMKRKKKKK